MVHRSKFTSAAYRKKKRQRALRLLSLYSFLGAVLITAFIIMLRLEFFSINEVGVIGNSVENKKSISSVAESEMTGSYFYLIPENNFIFYPRKKIEDRVLSEFPRIYYADISYVGENKVELEVRERKAFGVWCQISDKNCFFMDDSGYIFAEAPNFSGDVFFKMYGDFEGSPIRKSFNDTGWDINKVKIFVDKLPELDLKASSFEMLPDEGNAKFNLEGGGELLVSQKKELETIYRDLSDALAGNVIDINKPFEYIDLRFDNKVFYKTKE